MNHLVNTTMYFDWFNHKYTGFQKASPLGPFKRFFFFSLKKWLAWRVCAPCRSESKTAICEVWTFSYFSLQLCAFLDISLLFYNCITVFLIFNDSKAFIILVEVAFQIWKSATDHTSFLLVQETMLDDPRMTLHSCIFHIYGLHTYTCAIGSQKGKNRWHSDHSHG